MPRTYNYSLVRVSDAVRRNRLEEPFEKCVAIYKTKANVLSATIDGFSTPTITQPGSKPDHVEITATGSATIDNMRTGDIDKSLTVYVGYDFDSLQRQPTVSVTLTDKNGETFEWEESNEEARS